MYFQDSPQIYKQTDKYKLCVCEMCEQSTVRYDPVQH